MRRVGRLTVDDMDFIRVHGTSMTYEEIARKLDRTVDAVKNYAEKKLGMNIEGKQQVIYHAKRDIENRAYWKQLKRQFTEEELELFIYHWGLMYDQFREDVTHTEELQMVEVIKLQLLSERILIQQRELLDRVEKLKKDIQLEREKKNFDIQQIGNLERQIQGYYQSNDNLAREHRELSAKKQDIFKALKSTREQRAKNIEDAKESIVGWFRQVVMDKDIRVKYGIEMEKMRLAMEKERVRLSEYHQFEDGEVDRPILIPGNEEV